MKYLAILVAAFGLTAYADMGVNGDLDILADGHHQHHQRPCKELKLEQSQKTALKEAKEKFKKDTAQLRADMKSAKQAYGKVISDPKSDRTAADNAAAAYSASVTKYLGATTVFVNDAFYNILKPEQRAPALKCWMKRHRRPHHHGHHGHCPGGEEVEKP